MEEDSETKADAPIIDMGNDSPAATTSGENDKIQTFRQRRLTFSTLLNPDELQDLDDDENAAGGGDKKEEEFDDDDDDDDDGTKEELSSTTQTMQSNDERQQQQEQLESRILHASAPPLPKGCQKRKRSLLYMHRKDALIDDDDDDGDDDDNIDLQEGKKVKDKNEDTDVSLTQQQQKQQEEEWKKRRHLSPGDKEDKLPFPRHIVGTYSCHGIEPVFDYEGDDGDDQHHFKLPACAAKINQDRGGVAFPYANNSRMAIFAVYDGHGEGGEHIAQYALHEIPKRLEQHEDFLKGGFEAAFKDVFVNVDRDLTLIQDITPMYSGCTACVVLLKDKELFLANAGDSRAVMAQKQIQPFGPAQCVYKSVDLTVDQNPDSPGEQERIESMGGFVSPPPEEGLSARVWLDSQFRQFGLAMSRSIGDHAVKSVGVIACPVVTHYEITPDDDFIIIATDGVWEFLSSQQAVDLVAQELENGKGSSEACQCLIEAAAAMWHEHEGDYRDDITALVVRVKELWSN